MSEINLQFPKGEFTHTELAQANGKTNQQVWTAYQAAINAGIIVSTGLRPNPSGKGKPSKIWKVADGQPVPLVDKVVVVKVIPTEPVPLVKISEQPKVTLPAPAIVAVQKALNEAVNELPPIEPTTAPVVEVLHTEIDTEPEVEQLSRNVQALTCQVVEIEDVCPFCKTKLLSVKTDGGYKVWCSVNDFKICSSSENPYGCANTIKNAVEILNEKFFKHRA